MFVTAFLRCLYDILQDGAHAHIMAWNPAGTQIIIRDTSLLITEVLPQYFKLQNFESFVRQLNIYDFKKQRQHPEYPQVKVYQHPLFIRDCPELLPSISR